MKSLMSHGSIAALTAGAALASAAGAWAQDAARRPALAAEDARALLDATADPANAPPAERLYNAGVSMYRASEFALARELFAAAAERAKAGVAARSMYNRGTTSYAEALRAMQAAQDAAPAGPPGESASPDLLGETITSLERSLRELKDAVRADPTDADARANAELAHRVLKELKQQQQQQQQQSGDQDQEQNQQQDPQQNQDGDPQESGQGEQPNEREQDGQQDQQQPQDGQQSDSNQEGDRNEQSDAKPREESGKESEPKPEPNPDAKPTNESGEKSAERPKPMTRQEVERLLQRIRDKERARLIERMERERARTQPAPKDW